MIATTNVRRQRQISLYSMIPKALIACSMLAISGMNQHIFFVSCSWDEETSSTIVRDVSSATKFFSQVAIAVPLYFHSGSYHIYLNVGSPIPQRQLVIVDTGSHYTAFPCDPCRNCGSNTHASTHYFSPSNSSSFSTIPCGQCRWANQNNNTGNHGNESCGKTATTYNNKCQHKQRYTEGSSWTAYEAQDLVFVGTEDVQESQMLHSQLAVPFVFGCQMEETGLFVSQFADGIMGMAMHSHSLLSNLYSSNSIANMAFSMCIDGASIHHGYYSSLSATKKKAVKGGLFTMGGVDVQDLSDLVHHTNNKPMQFMELMKDKGWFTVEVKEVFIVSAITGEHIPVVKGGVINPFNTGKGTIVDSGTTDTFFPQDVAKVLRIGHRLPSDIWESAVKPLGIQYSNDVISLTDEEFAKLPSFRIILQGESTYGKDVEWMIRPESYFEPTPTASRNKDRMNLLRGNQRVAKDERFRWEGKRSFTNRIYLDELHGAVLGANSMIDHHILFDVGNHRIGIAPADCSEFDDVVHAS